MSARPDPYAVLGVARDADESAIHAAYRAAVRRTHPDAGGSAAAFEGVQNAYESLRDPARRGAWDARAPGTGQTSPAPPRAASPPPRASPDAANARFAGKAMEDLIADSLRLEDEARRLAGLPPRHRDADETADSVTAILRDAGQQLRGVADAGAREFRRRLRRLS